MHYSVCIGRCAVHFWVNQDFYKLLRLFSDTSLTMYEWEAMTAWIIATADGSSISSVHSTYMAGVCETCSHVGALAFTVDAFTLSREKWTWTGVQAYWKVPQGVRGVTPSSLGDTDFSSAALQKKRIDNFIRNKTATEVDTF